MQEESDRWQIEGPKDQENEDEKMASINEGGVKGGNIQQSALLQALAIKRFKQTQMFAFCLRPKHTSPLSMPPPAVQITINRAICCPIHLSHSEHPELPASSGGT